MANQIIDEPQCRNPDQDANDTGDEVEITGEQPSKQVEVGNTDQKPDDAADNG